MSRILSLTAIPPGDTARFGGKNCGLAKLVHASLPVPPGLGLSVDLYQDFVRASGLDSAITLELERKPLEGLRWEEIWDMSLRIRNRFLRAPMPGALRRELVAALNEAGLRNPLAVRSSAPEEDAAQASFAGLHESVLDVHGIEALLDAVRLVWASLWSDRALLYRRELRLDPARSAMAATIMPMLYPPVSGVAFSRDPVYGTDAVIEAVHGQGQALVDGAVAPDRWFISREAGDILQHTPAPHRRASPKAACGMRLHPGSSTPPDCAPPDCALPDCASPDYAPPDYAPLDCAPLDDAGVRAVWRLAMGAERALGGAADCEWCLGPEGWLLLQARPVTTSPAQEDDRPWYLGLHRSRANLEVLRRLIEEERLPAMEREADALAAEDLSLLSPARLGEALARRQEALGRWRTVYREEFIPMAHGVRLFGQVYNDRVRPRNPFAFIDLLATDDLRAVRRNRDLQTLARFAKGDHGLREALEKDGEPPPAHSARAAWDAFLERHGDLAAFAGARVLSRLVLAMSGLQEQAARPDKGSMETEFLETFPPHQREDAGRLLELGRAAYRLRDDDNIALGRFKAERDRTLEMVRLKLLEGIGDDEAQVLRRAVDEASDADSPVASPLVTPTKAVGGGPWARQLVGQPAGGGTAEGPARVVRAPADLLEFRPGEILVCDAVDPTMTFVAPLALAVVERRGGMLIHGAIIAREYGLPCVTGVDDATTRITTGQRIIVDGWLGLVILGKD